MQSWWALAKNNMQQLIYLGFEAASFQNSAMKVFQSCMGYS
jgi:hypothetical protein